MLKRLKTSSTEYRGPLLLNKCLNGVTSSNFFLQDHKKLPVPQLLKLKTMILNNHPSLRSYFNILTYTLIFKKSKVCSYNVQATLYYSFDRKKEEILRAFITSDADRERIFFSDGDHLYLNLEIYNLNSKI